jgi:hypothetical protein
MRIVCSSACLFTVLLLVSCPRALATDLSPEEILRMADRARGNVTGISWPVSVETQGRRSDRRMLLDVRGRGFDIHAETLEPARSKGNLLLMVKGNMWFYKPGLSKPVPISRRQKLMGDAAYGDIAATNYAEDYDVVGMSSDVLDGIECFVFELRSANKNTTYDGIHYWVEKERLLGVRAEYLTVSGKLFKTATMSYEQQVDDRPFLSAMRIQNELTDEQVTWIRFGQADLAPLADSLFNLNLLGR